jgi:hypothetical protein
MMLEMSADPVQELLVRVDAGELGDPLPVLAYVAGRSVELDEAELNEARRRAVVRRASTGDPQRDLHVDDPAVRTLAAELYDDSRRAALGAAIDALVLRARDLPHVREAAIFLAGDVEFAWRLYALALVAEELGE